jgi:hypothetical protein
MRNADLLLRQRTLIVRSQQLRAALARDANTLAAPLNRIGRTGRALAHCIRGPGLTIAALLSLTMAWRMRGGLRMGLRMWSFWRGWRSLRLWLRG